MRTKEKYMFELEEELKRYSVDDKDHYMEYYEELIMDALEDGKSEDETISSLDSPQDVVKNILYDRRNVDKVFNKKMSPLTLILLVLGAPLWAPLLAVVICLIFVAILLLGIAYFIIWLVPFIFGLFAFVCILGGAVGIFGSIPFMINNFVSGLMQLGMSVFMLGFGAICFYMLRQSVSRFVVVSVQIARRVQAIVKGSVRKYGFTR